MKHQIKYLRKQFRKTNRDPLGRWLLYIVYLGLGFMTAGVFNLWQINREYDGFLDAAGVIRN